MAKLAKLIQAGVMRNIHYEAESDDYGARVFTNLTNTPCPRCAVIVRPDIEHLCGNRAPAPVCICDGRKTVKIGIGDSKVRRTLNKTNPYCTAHSKDQCNG